MSKTALKLHKAHDYCDAKLPRLTVVMLHGIASDASVFGGLLSHLEKAEEMRGVRFVTYDLLGAGKSPRRDDLKYDYAEQLEALDNSLAELKANGPVVLLGHSMGTLIATRYADTHRRKVARLILVSPPVYRPEDFDNPMFAKGLEEFRKALALKNKMFLRDPAFNNEMELIVGDRKNYKVLAGINKPVRIIYGELDQIIAPFNIPELLKLNPLIVADKTAGRHGVTHEKYGKILTAIEEVLNETV